MPHRGMARSKARVLSVAQLRADTFETGYSGEARNGDSARDDE